MPIVVIAIGLILALNRRAATAAKYSPFELLIRI